MAPNDPKAAAPKAAAAAAPKAKPKKVKVEAIADGYYDNKLRRTGDVFFIDGTLPTPEQIGRKDGSKRDPAMPIMFGKWMKLADPDAQPHITSSNEVIRRENAATVAHRAEGNAPPAEDDPLGADGE
jgi:hypothetical protein